jgi:N6-adenosine-specific RNA methylase IME4
MQIHLGGFRVWSRATGLGRTADSHYSTMTLDDIKALPVDKIASDDCVLFMWATCPMLPEALEVIKSWGFEFKTVAFDWVKTNKKQNDKVFWGLGYWSRANAELCLLATKGNPKRESKKVHQVVWEHDENEFPETIVRPVMEHSQKPDEVRDRIVELIGDKKRVELFARKSAEGWQAIGNDIDGKDIRDVFDSFLADGEKVDTTT